MNKRRFQEWEDKTEQTSCKIQRMAFQAAKKEDDVLSITSFPSVPSVPSLPSISSFTSYSSCSDSIVSIQSMPVFPFETEPNWMDLNDLSSREQQEQKPMSLSCLPKDVLLIVTTYLSLFDLTRLLRVDKQFYRLCHFYPDSKTTTVIKGPCTSASVMNALRVRNTLEFSPHHCFNNGFPYCSEFCSCQSPKLFLSMSTRERISHLLPQISHITDISLMYCDGIFEDTLRLIGLHCPKLKKLDISGSMDISLDTWSIFLQQCRSLTHLSLQSCSWLTDLHIDMMLCYLIKLKHVNLSYCNVSLNGMTILLNQYAAKLKTLEMNHMTWFQHHAPSIEGMSRLLSRCKSLKRLVFGRMAMQTCRSYRHTMALVMASQPLSWTGITTTVTTTTTTMTKESMNFVSPSSFTCLNHYKIDRNPLNDEWIYKSIPVASKLEEIYLGHCDLTETGLNTLAIRCRRLKHIELIGCPYITDKAIDQYVKCRGQQLEILNLIGCSSIQGSCLSSIEKYCCSSLRRLEITCFQNNIQDNVVSLLQHCQRLQMFGWSHVNQTSVHYLLDHSYALSTSLEELRFLCCCVTVEPYFPSREHLTLLFPALKVYQQGDAIIRVRTAPL